LFEKRVALGKIEIVDNVYQQQRRVGIMRETAVRIAHGFARARF
jgi:hypothetical protein